MNTQRRCRVCGVPEHERCKVTDAKTGRVGNLRQKNKHGLWWPDADITARVARLKREREERCADGRHEDPDNSGMCIHCGAWL